MNSMKYDDLDMASGPDMTKTIIIIDTKSKLANPFIKPKKKLVKKALHFYLPACIRVALYMFSAENLHGFLNFLRPKIYNGTYFLDMFWHLFFIYLNHVSQLNVTHQVFII